MQLSEPVITRTILVVSCLPVFAAALYAACIYGRLDRVLKRFAAFLFLSAPVQLVTLVMWWYRVNNLPLLHGYVAAGCVLILFFYREIFRGFLDRRVLPIVALAFVAFALVNVVFFQPLFTFSSYTLTAESVLIVILSLSTFTIALDDYGHDSTVPARDSLRWINSGFFIYYSSNLLIFYFGDVFTRSFSVYLNQNTWILHSVFSMVMYTCFIIALWKRPRS